MKSRSIALLMVLVILLNTLSLTVYTPRVVADNIETPKNNQINPTYNVGKSGQVFESSPQKDTNGTVRAQDKTSETFQQESLDPGDKWNLNGTNEWNDFAHVDGNMTRLVVGVNGEKPTNYKDLEKMAATYRAKIVNTVSIRGEIRAAVVELPSGSITAFVEETRSDRLASYIEPSMKAQIQLVPNDPYWSNQWGPQKIEADWAWNTTIGDPSVLVAVVDTGIYYTLPDLAANYVPLGYDWVNNDNDPLDDHGHGTHVSGSIAGVINNGIGIAGLAQVRIMAEKVLDSGGWGYWDWVANGIIHAVNQGADIISMSLGGYGDSELVHDAVRYAYDSEVLIVAAAGNDNTNTKLYPAGYDEVVAVVATDQWDNKAWFSNWGDWIELAAPGVDIISTVPWGYESWSGTSMATPHVSGVAALVWSRYPNKTRDWVGMWLQQTADDLGDPGFDVYYGYGRINARRSVEQVPPAHELIAYNWMTPPYVEPGASETINATILNFGENNETDVTVQLFANDTLVDSKLVGFLASGNSTTVGLLWNPTVEGLYNVTLYAVPMPGETSLENNVLCKYIYVGFPVKAVVLHSAGNIDGRIFTNWQVLNNEWQQFGNTMVYIDYTTLNKDDITYEDIAATEADVLIISCAYDPGMGWQFADSEIKAIKRYVQEGHGLIATAGTLYSMVPNNNKLAPLFGLNETITWGATGTDLLHLINRTHPVFQNVPNPLVFPGVGTALPSDGRWDSNELVGGKYLALGHYQESAIVTLKGLVYISAWLEIIPAYYQHHLQLLYNAITWSRYQKPAHELVVSLDAPKYLQPGESALLNATVSNMGLSNESSVELSLIIDGTVVNSTIVPELLAGASQKITYLWAPSVEKMYNITASSPPLPGEEFTFNNVDSKIVFVRSVRFVLFDDSHDTDGDSLTGNYLYLYQLLTASGFVVDELTIGPITSTILTNYDILVLMDPELDFSPNEISDIQNWVASGGALISIPDGGYPPTINTLMAPYGVQMTGQAGGYGTTTNIVSHPITQGVNRIWVDLVREISVTSPSTTLALTAEFMAFLSATEGGEVVVVSDSNIMDNPNLGNDDNTQLMINIFNWVGIKPEHELVVSLDAPTFIEPSESTQLNATVRNRGLNNETYVELQLWINGTMIASKVVSTLPTGSSDILSYLWTPTVEGIYNVTAYAPPVSGEENIQNNRATRIVSVRPIKYVLFDQAHGNDNIDSYSTWVTSLASRGYVVETLAISPITPSALEGYDVFVTPQAYSSYSWDELSAIQNFVFNGGGLLVIGDDNPWIYTDLTNFAGITWAGGGVSGITTDITPHPVTTGVASVYLAGPVAFMYVTEPAQGLVRDPAGNIMLAVSEQPSGKVIGFADEDSLMNYNIGLADNLRLADNIIDWLAIPIRYEHDLALTLNIAVMLELGNSTVLNATVRNSGLNNETGVELYLLINGTVVSYATIPQLLVGESYTINHLWTPTSTGNYNITAYAPPVPGEENTANNILAKSVVVWFYMRLYLPHEWVGGGVPMGWYADDGSWPYTLPFDFPFYGINYRTIYISSNGLIAFTGPDASWGNSIPSLANKLAFAPAWDDWVTNQRPGDDIYIWQPDPNHIIIRWQVVAYYNRSVEANFEVTFGSDGIIKVNYGYNNGPISATIGISNGVGHILAEDVIDLNFINTILFSPFPLEHDLALSLDAPISLTLGDSVLVNATVLNSGLNNETNVELELLINGTIVDSVRIPELRVGHSYTLRHLWTPALAGIYNVTAYAPPIQQEALLTNNIATKSVLVSPAPARTYLFVDPQESSLLIGENLTINIRVANIVDLWAWQIKLYYNPAVLRWINATYPPGHVFEGRPFMEVSPVNRTDEEGTHILFFAGLIGDVPGFSGTGTLCQMTFEAQAIGTSPLTFSRPLGSAGDTWLWSDLLVDIPFVALDGIVGVNRPPYIRDVAVVNATSPVIEAHENWIVNISVVAKNQGEINETFTVTLYCGSATVETKTVNNLGPGENTTLTFHWNTAGVPLYVSYTIWAEASIVPGEVNTANNVFIGGTIMVKMKGDVNGDRKVDGKDIAIVAASFAAYLGHPRWNPQADLNQDGKIDGKDIALIAKNFGRTPP